MLHNCLDFPPTMVRQSHDAAQVHSEMIGRGESRVNDFRSATSLDALFSYPITSKYCSFCHCTSQFA